MLLCQKDFRNKDCDHPARNRRRRKGLTYSETRRALVIRAFSDEESNVLPRIFQAELGTVFGKRAD